MVRVEQLAVLAMIAMASMSACSLPSTLVGAPTLADIRIEQARVGWNSDISAANLVRDVPRTSVIWVTFSTDRDLTTYAKDYSASFGMQLGLCLNGVADASRQLYASGLVRLPDQDAVDVALSPHLPRNDGRHPYVFFVNIENRASIRFGQNQIQHDVRRQSDDLCFHFRGGPMWFGAPHRSLDFRIPYPLIAEALARAGLPHAPMP